MAPPSLIPYPCLAGHSHGPAFLVRSATDWTESGHCRSSTKMRKKKNSPATGPRATLAGYLACLVLTLAAAGVGLPLLYKVTGSLWTLLPLLILLVPALTSVQDMLLGATEATARNFFHSYLQTYMLLVLQFLALLSALPFFLLEMVFIVGWIAVLLGPVAVFFFLSQRLGWDIGRPIPWKETLLYAAAAIAALALELLYWKKLRRHMHAARDWTVDTLARAFRH